PAQAVRGIGPQRAAELARFGLATVEDLLYHLPFRYEDRRALRPLGQLHVGEEATAVGEVARVHEARAGRRGRRVLEVVLRDGDGLLLLVWFHQIPYFSRRLREGQRLVVHGRVEPPLGGGPKRIIHPEMEILGADEDPAALPRIVPAYETPTPFRPTGAQDRAFAEIAADLTVPHPMRRLLQGDVGSGKTLVALLAALTVIEAGHQAALMAPTELLAEQHLETVRPLAAPLGVEP